MDLEVISNENCERMERSQGIELVSYRGWIYDDSTDQYDVGLLFLTAPTLQSIQFPKLNMDSAFPVVGAKTYVLGWGDTDPGKFLSCTVCVLY